MRGTLYTKIIPWFFFTITVQVVLFFFIFNTEPSFQPRIPFFGSDGDRMTNLAWEVTSALSEIPRDQQDAVLERFAADHRVNLYLFGREGEQILGPPLRPPPELKDLIIARLIPHLLEGHTPAETLPNTEKERLRPLPATPPSGHLEDPRFYVHTKDPDKYWVGVRIPYKAPNEMPIPAVVLASSDCFTGDGLFVDLVPWAVVLLLFVLMGIVLWLPVIKRITSPLRRMTEAATVMGQGRFDIRVEEDRCDEIGRLGRSVNLLAQRLDEHLSGQSRFLADIAHELSSPIARAKLSLGIVESELEPMEQTRVRMAIGELENMSDLVAKLLAFTRTTVGGHEVRLRPVALEPLISDAISEESSDGEEILVRVDPGLMALGDRELLDGAIGNLLRNALRYTGGHGPIEITAGAAGKEVYIQVEDAGPGVPEHELTRIFSPFYRAEASRNRSTGGVGLGLTVVKTNVDACNGTVVAENRSPTGLRVRITLQAPTSRSSERVDRFEERR